MTVHDDVTVVLGEEIDVVVTPVPSALSVVVTEPPTLLVGSATFGPRGPAGATGPVASYVVQIAVTDPNGPPLTLGVGKAYYRINAAINGKKLQAVSMHVTTASSSGTPAFQIVNATQGRNLLSTVLTCDASEKDSITAAVQPVIDTASGHDVVSTGDELRLDCTGTGSGTRGVIIDLTFG